MSEKMAREERVTATAVAGFAFMLCPVLARDARTRAKEGMAAWYVGSRITEGAIFIVGVLALLAMLAVSEAMAGAPATLAASYEAVGVALSTLLQYSWIVGRTVFCVGAVTLYWLLLVSKRVPRWLAVWGLVAAPMVLAVWLIVWGPKPSATPVPSNQ